MRAFLTAFAGCFVALLLFVMGGAILMKPYFGMTVLAAHKIIGGPGEAKRLLLELDSMSPDRADKIVMEIYREYRRVK